jgi:AcrR family transcriptional regulator
MVIDPAYAKTRDPLERIFAILAGYRERILQTECRYGCPLGRLALEIDPENRPAHRLIAENFSSWIEAVRQCVLQFCRRLPEGTFVLSVMEGGVMLSRSYGSVEPFDLAVAQLRQHFSLLEKSRKRLRKKRLTGR